MKTRLLATTFALLASAALVIESQAADDVQNHLLDGIKNLEFQIAKANVQIVGTDRSDLELTLERPLMGFDPEKVTQTVEREGDTLVIKIEYEKSTKTWWWSSDNSGYTSAHLLVPHELAASIRTNGGNIAAHDLQAAIQLKTSGGHIKAADISGPLTIRTSGGNISLNRIQGDTEARTSGGNINIEHLAGKASVHTSGGNINIAGQISALEADTSGGHINADLESTIAEPLVLRTSGGNVHATLAQGMTAPAALSTSGGSVSIDLPHEQAFELKAKSNGGNVSLDHAGQFKGSLNQKKIEGTINGGGPLVTLSTNGGRVRISEI